MDLAALILAVLSLGLSLWTCIRFEAKERSQHVIQYVPAETALNEAAEKLFKADTADRTTVVTKSPKRATPYDPLADFDNPASIPLDEDEKAYFEKASKPA